MATIQYTINGTYAPFGVELRENNIGGAVVMSEVKEFVGTYQFNDVPNGNYVIVIYDIVGGITTSSIIQSTTTTTTTTTTIAPTTTTTAAPTTTTTTTTIAPTTTTTAAPTTTTTTTTTTLPPNPKLYVAVREAFSLSDTNTNSVYPSPATNLQIYITTDQNNTQLPLSNNIPALFSPVTISIGILGANNGQRITGVGGNNNITPQNVNTSFSWSNVGINQSGIVLPAGFTHGFIIFGARTNLTSPDTVTVSVFSNSAPFGNPYLFPSNPIDSAYQLSNDTYGYTDIDNFAVFVNIGIEDGISGGGF